MPAVSDVSLSDHVLECGGLTLSNIIDRSDSAGDMTDKDI